MNKRMKKVAYLVIGLTTVSLAGCATSPPPPAQTLFDGRYTNTAAVLDQRGCDVHAMSKCDYSDTIIAFAANHEVGGARLKQGPQAAWHDVDRRVHLKASVERNGTVPVARIERFDVEDACARAVEASIDQASKLTLPACGRYPEIRATWRTVSRLERMTERWATSLALLLTAVGGGELP